jgi:hypothetical protein
MEGRVRRVPILRKYPNLANFGGCQLSWSGEVLPSESA